METQYEVPKVTNIFDIETNDSASCVGCMIYNGCNDIKVHYDELKPKI